MRRFLMALFMLLLCGCTTLQNNRLPFSTFTGKEVVLVRSCVLEENITACAFAGGQPIRTYYEDGQPTDLVYDERMFTTPVKVVKNIYGQEQSLYHASDYKIHSFELVEKGSTSDDFDKNYRQAYGGPYRQYDIPAGTHVFIIRSYTFNGIDVVYHKADGFVTIPGTARRVKFSYVFPGYPLHPGGTACEYLGRAAWEDESVPEKRFVGTSGKEYRPDRKK